MHILGIRVIRGWPFTGSNHRVVNSYAVGTTFATIEVWIPSENEVK